MLLQDAEILTAIITPFNEDGTINYAGLSELVNHLIDHSSQGFIVGGTTGEVATLTNDEKVALYQKFVEIVDGRVPIVAGTGSNNTQATIDLSRRVNQIDGITALLVVVPYYNKPNQRGMLAHYTAVADNSALPIIIYNIPGRTGVTMANETILELAKNPKIIGVKQCTTIEDLEYLVEHAPKGFLVYSGEDDQSLAAKAIGAQGIISVASHVYGDQMRQMYDALEAGNVAEAGAWQRKLTPKMDALFMFPSPSGVKALLNAQGFHTGGCRLPIVDLTAKEEQQLAHRLGMPHDDLHQPIVLELGESND
ncbi:4-hydroxy-tetrahydrodipicolinate synthase [Lactobacillus sp. ESL0791]|uniref:4-hydroxy-tetrahydrodipicolinate synthase n=1 Tax=Lactobacillus sp. ESL0791 TaxID=2983234 RepID=UPI0023F94EF7|nr:4-hydroxy-tetrahydrodipicolinate synthase [Lactobacillus sp. ESL0791]MDF7638062.1 4-hydroxy-tetrahydrodipicolinate synthase [Lactobacillus sp. ESL0791]